MMSLRELCMLKLTSMIKDLPPQIRDEILEKSQKEVEKDERSKLVKEMKYYLPFVVDTMVDERIKEIGGISVNRDKFLHITPDVKAICEDTTDGVMRLIENRVMDNNIRLQQQRIYMYNTDSDMEYGSDVENIEIDYP